MTEHKKEKRAYLLILLLVSVLAGVFVSTMGFLNYRTTAITLEEQVIARLEEEQVTGIETAMGFGKSFENYYGMTEIFASFEKQYPGPSPFVINQDGKVLYSLSQSEEEAPDYEGFLASRAMVRALPNLEENSKTPIESGRYRAIFVPIHQDNQVVGYFGVLYTTAIFSPSFNTLIHALMAQTGVILLLEAAVLFVVVQVIRSEEWMKGHRRKADRIMERLLLTGTMAIGILGLSLTSLYTYQQDYRTRIETSVRTSMHNLEMEIEHVKSQGVDLREVDDLKTYIRDRVSSLETLHSVRITEHISTVSRTDEESEVLSFSLDSGSENSEALYLEAEISSAAISREMRGIVLVLTSTTIILLIFVFELNNLVELLTAGSGRKQGSFSEKQVSIALRFTGFLCSTAEYMCVPYAAMMIRASGESLFGLSVGMTAALPLTLEGVTQMIGMLVLPRYVKKFQVRKVLVFSAILMAACNLAAFAGGGALVIVLCRAVAGIAYAGFKQVSNYLITRGYETEAGRSENISQDNAGLLAGATCGAGLGAILSANAGYSATFLISSFVFLAYLVLTLSLLPWKPLSERSVQAEEEKPVQAADLLRMVFSGEMLFFILFIGIPLNIGVMLCVTLVPAICQTNGISSVMLSYCYIANGLAGIYIGPALVSKAKAKFGLNLCIAFAFALTAVSIFILRIPPVALMIVLTSMILGFLDGFATPMVTDRFMTLGIVRNAVDESTALIFSVVLSYVLLTFAPMIAELLLLPGKGVFSPMMIGAAVYAAAAVLVFLLRGKRETA